MPYKFPLHIGSAVIRPYTSVSGTASFELDFGMVAGKRLRIYRRSIRLAITTVRQKSKELIAHGASARLLTTDQRIEAAKCFTRLNGSGATLSDVVTFYLHHNPTIHRTKTLKSVAEEVLERKKSANRRDRYVTDLTWKFKLLLAAFPERHIGSISTEDMEKFISEQKWSSVSQKSYVQSFKVLFNFAVQRGYIGASPCAKIETPDTDQEEPVIFTLDQMRILLRLCTTTNNLKSCLPFVAIGAFAGLRPAEIERLDWAQVDFANKTITVLGANAKGRSRRAVDMSENLLAWITPIAKESGLVLPKGVREYRDRLKTAAGWDEWPHDALRHSFASYHFGHHKDQVSTCFQMGHRSAQMLFAHYRSLVTSKDAASFWNLYPNNINEITETVTAQS